MLKIYKSNQINFLLNKICTKIKSNKNILKKETILIHDNYIKQWLEIRISQKIDICMNVQYSIISEFFINLIERINYTSDNIQVSIFKKEHLKWILMSIIDNDNDSLFLKKSGILYKNEEFCSQMANIFIKYIFLQPKLIYQWEKKKKNNILSPLHIWQKKLWNLIIEKIKNFKQKNLTETINNIYKDKKKSYFSKFIPNNIFIFSQNPINPFIQIILHAIQNFTSIYLFQYQYNKNNNTNSAISLLKKKTKKSYIKKNFFFIKK